MRVDVRSWSGGQVSALWGGVAAILVFLTWWSYESDRRLRDQALTWTADSALTVAEVSKLTEEVSKLRAERDGYLAAMPRGGFPPGTRAESDLRELAQRWRAYQSLAESRQSSLEHSQAIRVRMAREDREQAERHRLLMAVTMIALILGMLALTWYWFAGRPRTPTRSTEAG